MSSVEVTPAVPAASSGAPLSTALSGAVPSGPAAPRSATPARTGAGPATPMLTRRRPVDYCRVAASLCR